MADATEILTTDHRQVEQLFDRYRTSKSATVVREICTELTVHSAVEEKHVYPSLGSDVDGGKGMRQHAEKEHQQVKDLILEIVRLGYGNPEADAPMQQIMQAVADHVEEEENDVFPKMRAELGEERLVTMGEAVTTMKEQLMAEAEKVGPLVDLTKDELEELARARAIDGRSSMTKKQLMEALAKVA